MLCYVMSYELWVMSCELCLPLISMKGQVIDDFDQMVSRSLPIIAWVKLVVDHHGKPMPHHRRWRNHKPCILNTNVASITQVDWYLCMLSWVLKSFRTNAVLGNCLRMTSEWLVVSPSGSHSRVTQHLHFLQFYGRQYLPSNRSCVY